jgi:hypothetical protein
MGDSNLVALVQVLDEVLSIVTVSEQDTLWTGRWDAPDEMVLELRDHANRLRRGDLSTLKELKFLFAPTGPLQEVAQQWLGRTVPGLG